MITGQLIDVTEHTDSIDTFESYGDTCIVADNTLVLPLVNILLIDGNVIGNLPGIRVEYSYLFLTDVSQVSWIGETRSHEKIVGRRQFLDPCEGSKTEWFAMNRRDASFELKTNHQRMYMYVPAVSGSGSSRWQPWHTPNYRQNVDSAASTAFWRADLLPASVCTELNVDKDQLQTLELAAGTPEEMHSVLSMWSDQ